MDTLNRALTVVFDAVLGVFIAFSPTLTLILAALLSGFVAAFAFRFLSNQKQMTAIADHSRARLLAIRLFPDDIAGIFASLGGLIALSGKRILHSLPSLLVLGPLFVIVLVQLAAWFEYRPLQAGESAVVTAQMKADEKLWRTLPEIAIEVPAGVRVETPALRDAEDHTISWRIGVENPSEKNGVVRLVAGSEVFEKQLALAADNGAELTPVSPRRPGSGFFDRVMHPRETAFPENSVAEAIAIEYPENPDRTIGWALGWPWWMVFVVISIVGAFAAQPLIGVKF